MKNNNNATANSNYNYSTIKSGNQTIVVWDDLAKMMMGNCIPPQGVRVLKDKGDKRK